MKKIIIAIVIIISVFLMGTYAGASTTFMGDLLDDSKKKLAGKVETNTNTLVVNLDDEIKTRVNERLSGAIDVYSNNVNTEIKKYYDEKLKDVALSPEVSQIVVQLDANAKVFVASEKEKIDKALAELLGK